MRLMVHDADDEEPDCCRCDHVLDDDKLCNEYCGPEHRWNRYQRTERVDDNE